MEEPLSSGAGHSMVTLFAVAVDFVGLATFSGTASLEAVSELLGHGDGPSELVALIWIS